MKRFLLLALGLALVLAVAATGCGEEEAGASAAEKLDKAWTKMNEVTAVHEEFDIQMEIDGDLSEMGAEFEDLLPATMGITGSADVDQSDEDNIKADIALELDVADLLDKLMQSSLGDTMDSDAAMGMQMISGMLKDIKIRIVDNVLYMELLGSWYEMPMDESGLEDLTGGSVPGLDLGGTGAEDAQCVQDKLVPSKMLTSIEEKGKEDIDGTETTHITASLDTGATIDLLAEISSECTDEEPSDSEITEAKDMLEKMVTKADVEVWIDGDDNIRKVTLDVELDMTDVADEAGGAIDPESAAVLEGMTISLTMTLEMSAFGEEVTVEAPEDAMPIEDLLGAFGGVGGMDDFGLDDGGTGTTGDDFDFGDDSGTSTTDRSYTNPSL